MERKSKDDVEWLEFELLSDIPGLTHGVFLRHGGVSKSPYDSLNCSFDVGDDQKTVQTNLKRIQNCLDENPSIKVFWGKQCHGKNVAVINKLSSIETPFCDGLITNEPLNLLLVKHADCQAAIFYDSKHHVIANVHAGWRGSVQNIYRETINVMKNKFSTNPADLLVCIGPSLGPDDAEFIHYTNELPENFWKFQSKPTYFDFWSISSNQLQEEGVLSHHIEISGISTQSNPHDYYSYRRAKVTGRHATCVMLQ